MNEFEKYYINQAGSGLAGFSGIRYQKGSGFFGRILTGAVYPLLRFLGKNALSFGANLANDVFDSNDFSGKNIGSLARKNLEKTGKTIFTEAASKMKGSGKRKRKRLNLKSLRKPKRKCIKGRKRTRKSTSRELFF